MFKKIICGIDGSDYSSRAAALAAKMAKTCGATLDLVYVVPIPIINLFAPSSSMITPEFLPQQMEDNLKNRGREILDETNRRIENEGIMINQRLEMGHPADILASLAQDENFDLMVVGSRGMSEIKGLLMGSVSTSLIHSSPCPVLIVK